MARDAGVTEFLVQVHRETVAGEWNRTCAFSDQGRPLVLPTDRTVHLTQWIQLPYVTLTGYGLYAVTIFFRTVDSEYVDGQEATPWEPDGPGWWFGEVDYFRVVKP